MALLLPILSLLTLAMAFLLGRWTARMYWREATGYWRDRALAAEDRERAAMARQLAAVLRRNMRLPEWMNRG